MRKYILKLISQSKIRKKGWWIWIKISWNVSCCFFNLNQITNTRKREEEIRKQKDEFNRLQNEIKQLQEESLRKENQQKEIIEKIEKQHQEELQILKYKEQNRQYEELIYNIQTQNTQEMKVLSDQIKILQNKIDSNICFIM